MPRLPPRAAYLRRLDRLEGLDLWRVDGHLIRNHMDVEFTNGHHHFSRRYVPVNEIWLDREAPGAGEWPLWALHQLVERRRMAQGDGYLTAYRVASRVERAERRRSLDVGRGPVTAGELAAIVRRRSLGAVDGRTVWLVDGRAVRDLACVDFTLGGHGYRYRFISRREIWLDDAVRPSERAAILHHEVVEVALMARGLRYEEAHARASRAETRFRRRDAAGERPSAVPRGLVGALVAERVGLAR